MICLISPMLCMIFISLMKFVHDVLPLYVAPDYSATLCVSLAAVCC